MITEKQVYDVLSGVMDPELGRNLVELGMIKDLSISGDGEVAFTLAFTIAGCPLKHQIERDAREAVLKIPGVKEVNITQAVMSDEERKALFPQGGPELPKLNKFNKIERIIAVMSGKGGVGKSSITALLGT